MRNMLKGLMLGMLLIAGLPAQARDPLDQVDLDTPAMSEAELTRQQVEALIDEARSTGAMLDLSRRRLSGLNLSGLDLRDANLRWARFNRSDLREADMAADLRNQSMGLMRTVLASARADGADFRNARMGHVDAKFASLRGARLDGADARSANFAGADLRDASITELNLTEADLDSARMPADADRTRLVGLDRARNVERARW